MGLTEADDGREAAELGVADALGDGEAGNGNTSKQIVLKHIKVVFGKPIQYGDEILDALFHSVQCPVILKLSERIVGEKRLFQIRFQLLPEWPRIGKAHFLITFERTHHREKQSRNRGIVFCERRRELLEDEESRDAKLLLYRGNV